MKKLIVLTIALFTFSLMNAQFSLGAKTGVNLASWNVSNDDFLENLEGRIAYHVGIVAEISLSDQFSVQPEILYNSVGAKFPADNLAARRAGVDTSDIRIITDYLSSPVMVKYYPVEGLGIEVGPQVGFLLAAKMKNDTDEEDIKDEMESIDFGIGFGASYKLEMGVFFDARYVLGMTNIITETEFDDDDFIKNNVFQFSVGYMFL